MPFPQEHFFKKKVSLLSKTSLSVGLVYPEGYPLAMSNLGFQVLWGLFNEPGIRVERFFYQPGHKPRSLESGCKLTEFDLIALSLSYEPDFLNFLKMLEASGLPGFSRERSSGFPLFLGGGIGLSVNPEPYAPFLDMIFLGEAEESMPIFLDILMKAGKERWHRPRGEFLKRFTHLEGFYMPSLSYPDRRIKRVSLKSLNKSPACSAIISAEAEFKDTFLLEINRGCPWKCLFCLIGWNAGPVRFLNKEIALEKIKEALRVTRRLGFIGTALTDYKELGEIIDFTLKAGGRISFSSLRLTPLNRQFLEALRKSGQKMVTLAPEAGSERLRFLLGKHIKNSEIEETLQLVSETGLPQVKLYFMYGLPSEGEEDLKAIPELLLGFRKKIPGLKFIISLSAFVPKPWTPLQWHPMEREKVLKEKFSFLKRNLLRIKGCRVTGESIRRSILEGLLSRGDRGIIEVILSASKEQIENLKERYLYRQRREDEPFPWDFIDNGLDKKELYRIYGSLGSTD